MLGGRLCFNATAAPAITRGSLTVVPVAKSIVLRDRRGGVVVSWPSSVLVLQEGRTVRIPVFNVTRCAQAAILVAALAMSTALLRSGPRKERLP